MTTVSHFRSVARPRKSRKILLSGEKVFKQIFSAEKMERPKREDFDKICRLCLKSASLVNIFDRNPKTQQESLSTLVRETVEMLGLTVSGVHG